MIPKRDRAALPVIAFMLLFAPVIVGAGRLCAQERKIQNRPYLDDRVWHYGFLIGVNMQDLHIANSGYSYVNSSGKLEQWRADVPEYTPGFSVGVLGELMANRQPSWEKKSVTLNDILLQRRIELWGEGFAFFDLKRTNRGFVRNYEGTNHVAGAYTFDLEPQDPAWTYQIPDAEIQENTHISNKDQND